MRTPKQAIESGVESLEILTKPIPESRRGKKETYLIGINSADMKNKTIKDIKENKKLAK
jgi:hypothetical protein